MRSVSSLLLAITLLAGALYAYRTSRRGLGLRSREVGAGAAVEELMGAQEDLRRLAPPERADAPYRFLSDLPDVVRRVGLARDPDDPPEVWRRDGYLFHLRLLWDRDWRREPPAEGSGGGRQYEIWAWPAEVADSALVVVYGSSAGYLVQGENGSLAGPRAVLPRPDDNPIRLLEHQRRAAASQTDPGRARGADLHWTILKNLREAVP